MSDDMLYSFLVGKWQVVQTVFGTCGGKPDVSWSVTLPGEPRNGTETSEEKAKREDAKMGPQHCQVFRRQLQQDEP